MLKKIFTKIFMYKLKKKNLKNKCSLTNILNNILLFGWIPDIDLKKSIFIKWLTELLNQFDHPTNLYFFVWTVIVVAAGLVYFILRLFKIKGKLDFKYWKPLRFLKVFIWSCWYALSALLTLIFHNFTVYYDKAFPDGSQQALMESLVYLLTSAFIIMALVYILPTQEKLNRWFKKYWLISLMATVLFILIFLVFFSYFLGDIHKFCKFIIWFLIHICTGFFW